MKWRRKHGSAEGSANDPDTAAVGANHLARWVSSLAARYRQRAPAVSPPSLVLALPKLVQYWQRWQMHTYFRSARLFAFLEKSARITDLVRRIHSIRCRRSTLIHNGPPRNAACLQPPFTTIQTLFRGPPGRIRQMQVVPDANRLFVQLHASPTTSGPSAPPDHPSSFEAAARPLAPAVHPPPAVLTRNQFWCERNIRVVEQIAQRLADAHGRAERPPAGHSKLTVRRQHFAGLAQADSLPNDGQMQKHKMSRGPVAPVADPANPIAIADLDVKILTEKVVRQIDRRIVAARERMGKT